MTIRSLRTLGAAARILERGVPPSADRRALDPELAIFDCSVVRFMPNCAAAPAGPPTIQLASSSARRMCSRSASSRVVAVRAVSTAPGLLSLLQLGERHVEVSTARQDHRALDEVLELADVARPVIARQRVHRASAGIVSMPLVHAAARTSARSGGRAAGCPRGVRAAAGLHDREDVQAVVEIAAGTSLAATISFEVAIGRRDEPHVDADRPRAAEPLELLLLQDAQQLRLQLERDVADLVEEQRAAVGELEPADAAARSRR